MLVPINKPLSPGLDTPEYLGGKGYGLYWMAQQGVSVPFAMIIPTSACVDYMKKPKSVMKSIAKEIKEVKAAFVSEFGYMPLLSVRSGARVSMPGMMDTILNVGLDASSFSFWSDKLGSACVSDCFARLADMYGSVVLGNKDLRVSELPDADGQLLGAIEAVFKSWNNDRAKFYRKMHNIPEEWGTAVVIQAMVFGNLNDNSGTGVLFTRNPDSGENVVTGEFLIKAQGEDVVAGVRTPAPLSELAKWNSEVSAELMKAVTALEAARKDVQDIEFTIQDGKLYILQTRNAKRSAKAALKIALDMVKEGMLSVKEAVKRVSPRDFDLAQQAVIDPKFKKKEAFKGIPACSGVVYGKPVFSAQDAINCKEPCILITQETAPDDIAGMNAAVGVVTMTGGATSHAAVVARGMNKPCVVGVSADLAVFKGHPVVGFDGASGKIWLSAVPVVDGNGSADVAEWRAMVCEEAGVVPVVSAPTKGPKQQLLDLSNKLHGPDAAIALLKAVLKECDKLYVDLREDNAAPADKRFIAMFFDSGMGEAAFGVRMSLELSDEEKKKVVLVGSSLPGLFESLGKISDLSSLILAQGECVIEEMPNADAAVAKVLAWKKDEPYAPVSLGKYVAGMKSIITPEQAMQYLMA